MTQTIKVRFKAYDNNLLDQTVREIVNAVKRTGAQVNGPIPLPTRKTIITVLRSPHGDKKSREQFETRTHKRLMYIIDPSPQTMEALMKLDISAGVDITMKQD
ncbi:MAG: 30S ribosomal protein S10 [SAR324 cluster bacterium]|nr:30S ribosomal protein S10 [SAR324 cluster bacterium]